jgi:polyisoprenyl-phosphate glycosyltransferase
MTAPERRQETHSVSVVVPVFNSAGCIEALAEQVVGVLQTRYEQWELILVNDGSSDQSWKAIADACARHPQIIGIDLRRNFGQDNAILTGLRQSSGSFVVIMDDDLQHDPEEIPRLVEACTDDTDVVYAAYKRKHQSWWKNLGSRVNGKAAQWFVGKPRGLYLSPYKLIRRAIATEICRYEGPFPYLDGLLLQATARIGQVPVEHQPRHAGAGNYGLLRSLSVWMRVVSSFSAVPLRLVALFGFLFAGAGLVLAFAAIGYRLVAPGDFSEDATGWTSLMVAILVLGGIQMIFLGIIGEYVGRAYVSANRKPQATIRTILNHADQPARTPSSAAADGVHLERHDE